MVLTHVGCGERRERVVMEERWLRGTACWQHRCPSLSVAGCMECSQLQRVSAFVHTKACKTMTLLVSFHKSLSVSTGILLDTHIDMEDDSGAITNGVDTRTLLVLLESGH